MRAWNTVPVAKYRYFGAFSDVLLDAGAPVERLLAGAKLSPWVLEDPERLVSEVAIWRFVGLGARDQGMAELGARVGERCAVGVAESFAPVLDQEPSAFAAIRKFGKLARRVSNTSNFYVVSVGDSFRFCRQPPALGDRAASDARAPPVRGLSRARSRRGSAGRPLRVRGRLHRGRHRGRRPRVPEETNIVRRFGARTPGSVRAPRNVDGVAARLSPARRSTPRVRRPECRSIGRGTRHEHPVPPACSGRRGHFLLAGAGARADGPRPGCGHRREPADHRSRFHPRLLGPGPLRAGVPPLVRDVPEGFSAAGHHGSLDRLIQLARNGKRAAAPPSSMP